MPVNLLGHDRGAVADQVGYLLDGDSVVTHDRDGSSVLAAFRGVDQGGDVAHDLVPRLGAADGPSQDRVDGLQGSRGEVVPAGFEPVIDVVGGQLLELVRADERDEVGLGEALVVVDRLGGQSLGALGEPVADGVLNRGAVAGLDARFWLGDGLPELVLDDLLGSAIALEAVAVALAVGAEVDGSRVPVVFRVDRAFVLADDEFQRLPPS